MRVAVTGAGGFVGARVARALAARGHRVLAFGRRPAPARPLPAGASYAAWDLARAPLAEPPPVDAVVHCAARVGDWGPEAEYHAANVDGTRRVLDAFPGARVVYVSTSSVYADGVAAAGVREDAPAGACARSAYARTKAAGERVVLADAAAAGVPHVVLRPHVVYGPGDATLLPRVLARRRAGRLALPDGGRHRVSCTHVDNLARAVLCALDARGAAGAFNVADQLAPHDAPPLAELVVTLLARLGRPTRVVAVPAAAARAAAAAGEALWRALPLPGAPPLTRYAAAHLTAEHTLDCARAAAVLGYRPRWTFRDGPLAAPGEPAPPP